MDRGVVRGSAIGGGSAVAPKETIADEGSTGRRVRHLGDAGTPRRRLRCLLLRCRRLRLLLPLLLLLAMKDVVGDARREVVMPGRVAERPARAVGSPCFGSSSERTGTRCFVRMVSLGSLRAAEWGGDRDRTVGHAVRGREVRLGAGGQ